MAFLMSGRLLAYEVRGVLFSLIDKLGLSEAYKAHQWHQPASCDPLVLSLASIERGLLTEDCYVFSTDCSSYLIVISFKVFVLDGERRICPIIEFASKRPGACRGVRLGNFLGDLAEIIPVFSGRHVVYCVPLTNVHARMYRRFGFVAVEGVGSERPMMVLDLRSI